MTNNNTMKTVTVKCYSHKNKTTQECFFGSYLQAAKFCYQTCESLSIRNFDDMKAGGIGYDFTLQIEE